MNNERAYCTMISSEYCLAGQACLSAELAQRVLDRVSRDVGGARAVRGTWYRGSTGGSQWQIF